MDYKIKMSTTLRFHQSSESIIDYRGTLVVNPTEETSPVELGWFELTHVTAYDREKAETENNELHMIDIGLRTLVQYEPDAPLQVWYLSKVVIHPQCRGQGHGSNLIYRLLRHASHTPSLSVFVARAIPLDDNGTPLSPNTELTAEEISEKRTSLRRLYKRLGFQVVDILLPNETTPLFYHDLEYELPPPPANWPASWYEMT